MIVLTHTGPVFCSGADLKETAAAFAAGTVPAGRMGEVLAAIWECPKPVVARVGGPARAGGLGLVAAADIAVCADRRDVRVHRGPARRDPGGHLGDRAAPAVAPGRGRAVPDRRASTARRAAEIGLVTAAVPAAELDAAVGRVRRVAGARRARALAATKALLRGELPATGRDRPFATNWPSSPRSRSASSPRRGREGVLSFVEKRDPAWVPTP